MFGGVICSILSVACWSSTGWLLVFECLVVWFVVSIPSRAGRPQVISVRMFGVFVVHRCRYLLFILLWVFECMMNPVLRGLAVNWLEGYGCLFSLLLFYFCFEGRIDLTLRGYYCYLICVLGLMFHFNIIVLLSGYNSSICDSVAFYCVTIYQFT